jgi:membrane-bound serine protease (ClpP class)
LSVLSSVVEHSVYTRTVGGSTPSARTPNMEPSTLKQPIKTFLLTSCLCLWPTLAILAQDNEESSSGETTIKASQLAPAPFEADSIYVIPVQGDIDPSILYVIRRGIKEAIAAEADAVILHMDTYGGRVDSTDKIYEILKKFPRQDRLVTFIDDRAGSAGSFISAATAHIFMSRSSVIGAADVIVMGPQGVQDISEDYQEKLRSFMRGIVRATAEQQGHNPDVFEAMVDPNLELKIGGQTIVEEGKLLTLTNIEATREYGDPARPLLSRGTFDNIDDLNAYLGSDKVQVTKVEPSGFEMVGTFLMKITPLLIGLAFLLGYVEFNTQGFGFFGMAAIICIILVFIGHNVAGLTGYLGAVLFFLGLLFLIVEVLLLPGTLAFGVMGLLLMVAGLMKTMIDYYPGDPVVPTLPQLQMPVVTLVQSFLISVVGILLAAYYLPKTRTYDQLILDSTAGTNTSSSDRPLLEVGMSGTAQSYLRPSGRAIINDNPVDVVSEGDFIEAGTDVRIVEIRGSTVIVEKVESA